MTESERIEFLIKSLEGGNASAFAQKIGAQRSWVSRVKSGKFSLKKRITDILRAYPMINREWLMTGEGYPGDLTTDLVKTYYENKLQRADSIIDHLTRRLDELENELRLQKGLQTK